VRFSRSLLAVFAVGTLTLSLTACGGDDGGLDGNASAEDLADAIEEASGGEVSADDVEDVLGNGGLSDACIGASYAGAAMFGAMSGTELDGEAKEYFENAADDVPDEIKEDFAVLAEMMSKYSALIEEHGDLASAMADPEVLAELEELSSPEYEAASENVNAWYDANCDTTN
jgi:hypothetical protein